MTSEAREGLVNAGPGTNVGPLPVCVHSSTGRQLYLSLSILSAFVLQGPSGLVMTGNIRPVKRKIFTIWSITEKVCSCLA